MRFRRTPSSACADVGREYNSVRNVPRRSGERRLDDALKALGAALRAARVEWMIIGGIAVIARGVRRMTTDIDAVVLGATVDAGDLLRVFARHAVQPRIGEAEAFADKNLVLLLRHVPTGVDLDVSLGWTDFEREAIESSTPASYGRASYPMARAEDLVVFKALAARPKDIEDASALLLMHPGIDVAKVRRRLADLAALAEEPALLEGLEQVIARTRAARKAASKRAGATLSRSQTPKRTKRRVPRKN
jgi:hypothetical protein